MCGSPCPSGWLADEVSRALQPSPALLMAAKLLAPTALRDPALLPLLPGSPAIRYWLFKQLSTDLEHLHFCVCLREAGEASLTHSNEGSVHQGGWRRQAEGGAMGRHLTLEIKGL